MSFVEGPRSSRHLSPVGKKCVLLTMIFLLVKPVKTNFSEILPFVNSTPTAEAAALPQAIQWNMDLRWSDLLEWDVKHSSCWGCGNLSAYYPVSVQKKWRLCRLTAAYLNSRSSKQTYKSAVCAYIKCALHWQGWVNDDYSYNEARGENKAADQLQGLPHLIFSRLMQEYRNCSTMYHFPLSDLCSENLEFARCHIQAFNTVCDAALEQRAPFRKHHSRGKPQSGKGFHGRSIGRETVEEEIQPFHHSSEVASARTGVLWLTAEHFCSDICHSACSVNDRLYT